MPSVAVVIPSWNSRSDLPRCLESLREQTYPPAEIHIIDNGSSDGTGDWIRSSGHDVSLVEWPGNRGFSAACNEGIRRAQTDFVLILNADTWLDPNCLLRLVEAAEEHPDCSLSPKLLRADGQHIDSTGILLRPFRFSPKDRGEGELDEGQYDHELEVFGPTGAASFFPRAMLVSASVKREVYDEDFFAYYEDVDLAWRLRDLGHGSRLVPEAVVYHGRRGPGKVGDALFARAYANRYLYFIKNASLRDWLLRLPVMLPVELVRLVRIFVVKPGRAFAFLPILLKSMPKAREKRRTIRKMMREKRAGG